MTAVTVTITLATGASWAMSIEVLTPARNQPVFGEVDFEIGLDTNQTGPVQQVQMFVDGLRVATLADPPFKVKVDVGDFNRPHEFRTVVELADGRTLEDEFTTPAIRIDEEVTVQLQQLYVSVLSGGRRVLDLERDDFRVVDAGRRQEIVAFARGDIPFTASLLIDSSESMRGEPLEAALAGARAMIEGMQEGDLASVHLFSHGLLKSTGFSGGAPLLDALADGVDARGNTSISDHLYLALSELEAQLGRRVVILLSDGADLHSVLDIEDVLWKARRSQAMIYWIRLQSEEMTGEFLTSWRDAPGNSRQIKQLARVVEEGGGRIIDVASLDDIEPAFKEVLAELREQYILGYYPTGLRHDGSWRAIDISVRGLSNRVRARRGYVDY